MTYEVFNISLDATANGAFEAVDCWRAKKLAQQMARKAIDQTPALIQRPISPKRRAAAVERAKGLVAAGYGEDLQVRWPEGVPTLRESDEQTGEDLDKIFTTIAAVEALHGVSFPVENEDPKRVRDQDREIGR